MYKKNNGILGIVITIIILIILVFLTNTDIKKLSYIENVVNTIIMPIQNGYTYLKNKIAKNDSFFANLDKLKQENNNLKEENSELSKKLRELEMIKSENSTLKEYLKLTEKYKSYTTVPAYIINKDISNYSNIYVINAGSKDGIKENMTVIADKGLVGHVISVTENTAKVQTIIDAANSVSASISTTRDSILCKGSLENNILKGNYIPTDAEIIDGENIETSGMGGIYPKGIHIGKITKVVNTKNTLDRFIEVTPAVDFTKIETVLVIIK